MIRRFRSHIDDFDDGAFEKAHTREPGAQKVMISKEDSYCGGHPEPIYFITFVVADAAPVDVFNVLAATLEQPQWLCSGCSIKLVKNDLKEQVQGFAAAYRALPLSRREFFQWQAYDVNFTSDEFLIGVAGRHNQELHRLQAQEPDATVGRMCFAFSHIMRHPAGTLVRQFTQFDGRFPFQMGPFSPRNIYHLIWRLMLERVPKIITRAQQQAEKKWGAQRLAVPAVFLGLNVSEDDDNFVAMPNVTNGTTDPAKYASTDLQSLTELPQNFVWIVVVALCYCNCVLFSLIACWAFNRFCGKKNVDEEESGSESSEFLVDVSASP